MTPPQLKAAGNAEKEKIKNIHTSVPPGLNIDPSRHPAPSQIHIVHIAKFTHYLNANKKK